MDRLKLAALGERLKTGGAQMSRKVSGKWKEFLQVQTHEAKMVEEATSESLSEPNWGLNLRICGLLNAEEFSGPEVMRAIKKKIAGKSMVSQRFSLDLLEACAMNCDKVFSEIASEKVLEEMVRLVDNPQTHFSNKERALQLIRAWGESTDLGYLPVFRQTYLNLQARGVSFSTQDTMNLASLMESNVYQEPLSLPEGYPNSHMDMPNADQIPFAYYQSLTLSAEEKKEALEVARNSIELLSSMLNPATQEKPVKDDLTLSLLEKCKQSQSVIQRIVESTTEDEGLLFEALNIHENLQQILSKYEEPDAVPQLSGHPVEGSETASGSSGHDYVEKMEKLNSPPKSEKSGTSNGQENAG